MSKPRLAFSYVTLLVFAMPMCGLSIIALAARGVLLIALGLLEAVNGACLALIHGLRRSTFP